MSEVARSGEDHSDPRLVCSLNHLFIADAASRLDDRLNARLSGLIHTISKGEKCIRCQDASLNRSSGLLNRDANRIHSAHLPRPDSIKDIATLRGTAENNRI